MFNFRETSLMLCPTVQDLTTAVPLYYTCSVKLQHIQSETHLLSFSPAAAAAAADVGTQAAPWGPGRWRAEWTAIKSLGLLVRLRFRTALIPLCPWALFPPPVQANGRVGEVEELPAAPALHWAAWNEKKSWDATELVAASPPLACLSLRSHYLSP